MKRTAYLIGLLLSMITIISLCVFLWTTKVYVVIKIIVSILGIITSLIIFKIITKINNNYINQIDKKECFIEAKLGNTSMFLSDVKEKVQ